MFPHFAMVAARCCVADHVIHSVADMERVDSNVRAGFQISPFCPVFGAVLVVGSLSHGLPRGAKDDFLSSAVCVEAKCSLTRAN